MSTSNLIAQEGRQERQGLRQGNGMAPQQYAPQERNSGYSNYSQEDTSILIIGPSGETVRARGENRQVKMSPSERARWDQLLRRAGNDSIITFVLPQNVKIYAPASLLKANPSLNVMSQSEMIARTEGQRVQILFPEGDTFNARIKNGRFSMDRNTSNAVQTAIDEQRGEVQIQFQNGVTMVVPNQGGGQVSDFSIGGFLFGACVAIVCWFALGLLMAL